MGKTPDIDIDIRQLYRKNYIINGAIDFAQRIGQGGSDSGVGQGYYWDRIRAVISGGGFTIGLNHAEDAPADDPLLRFSANMGNQTAIPSLGAGDAWGYEYRMEGFDFDELWGKRISVSFWFKGDISGTFSYFFCINGTGGSQSTFVRTFSYSSPGVWQRIKIENIYIDPSIEPNALHKGNNLALQTGIMLAAGTSFQVNQENTWVDTSGSFAVRGLDTQTNGLATVSTDFWLTGLQLTIGASAEDNYNRYGENLTAELAACHRYYAKTYHLNVKVGTTSTAGALANLTNSGGDGNVTWYFPEPMRSDVPTITGYNPNNGNVNQWGNGVAPTIYRPSRLKTTVLGAAQGADNNVDSGIQLTAEAEI